MPTTSAQSPDSLPIKGYTVDQLKSYIKRQLGSPVWTVEITEQQIIDGINDALALYSVWCPRLSYHALRLARAQHEYLEGVDCGQGIVQIDFVEPNPVPTEIFYGNLIDPAPLFRTGLDEYDTFLRWRKVWMRVTSVQPQWRYDEARGVLYIHNPIERYHAGVICYTNWSETTTLSQTAALWVKEYALEASRYLYGEVLAKFGGAIPGPLKELKLDTAKRDKAEAKLEKMREKLQGMQTQTPIMID